MELLREEPRENCMRTPPVACLHITATPTRRYRHRCRLLPPPPSSLTPTPRLPVPRFVAYCCAAIFAAEAVRLEGRVEAKKRGS